MIIAGILSFLFGVAQAFLLQKALKSILGMEYMRSVFFFLIKTVLYAAVAVVLVLFLKRYLFACAIGYVLGLPVAVTCFFACKTFQKGNKKKRG